MEDQDHDNLETAAPPLSASKQTRILIWRDEVASSTSDDQHSQQQRTSDAASSSATSTTTSSSSSGPALLLSRGRQLFSRLARRLSAQGSGDDAAPQHSTGKFSLRRRRSAVEPPSRTAMYAALSPDNAAAWTAQDADADDEGDEEEEPKMDAKLREKQERLMRAARLLDQGVAN